MGGSQEHYHRLGMSFCKKECFLQITNTHLYCLLGTSTFTISKKALKALADTVTSSRRTLTLTNVLADETHNPPIDDTTNNSPTDDMTNPLADDTIVDNDSFLFPGADDIFTANYHEFQLHRLKYKKV